MKMSENESIGVLNENREGPSQLIRTPLLRFGISSKIPFWSLAIMFAICSCSTLPKGLVIDDSGRPSFGSSGRYMLSQFRDHTKNETFTILFDRESRNFRDIEVLDGVNFPTIDSTGSVVTFVRDSKTSSSIGIYDLRNATSSSFDPGRGISRFPVYNSADGCVYYFFQSYSIGKDVLKDSSLMRYDTKTASFHELRPHVLINGPISISPNGRYISYTGREYSGVFTRVIDTISEEEWVTYFESFSAGCFADDDSMALYRIGPPLDAVGSLLNNASIVKWEFRRNSVADIILTAPLYARLSFISLQRISVGQYGVYREIDLEKHTIELLFSGNYAYLGDRNTLVAPDIMRFLSSKAGTYGVVDIDFDWNR